MGSPLVAPVLELRNVSKSFAMTAALSDMSLAVVPGEIHAVVGENGLVTIRSVKIGRNYGQTVEALSGVTVADRLILNPSDSLTDGDKVTVVVAEKEPKDSKGAKDGKK